jgi:hypothetical protein
MQPLLVPQLMPDEFLPGYERRIASINGFINYELSKKFIQSHFANMTGDSDCLHFKAYVYARICNVDIHDLVRNHTLLPIFRATTKYKSDHRHGNPRDEKIVIPHTSKRLKEGLQYCDECTSEDLDFHGFTYWRRSHQIPGIDWCTKHASPLYEYSAAETELYSMPDPDLKHRVAFLNEEIENNPTVRNFTEVIQATLELDHPIHTNSFFRQIIQKADEIGVYTGSKGDQRPLLSDLALESIPNAWLKKHFPAFNKKVKGELLSEFDHSVTSHGRSSVASIYNLLALSLVFNSPSKSLSALMSVYNSKVVYPDSKLQTMKTRYSQVIPQYIACKGNIHLMSKAMDCHYTTLKHHMKKRGLPSLVQFNTHTTQAILDYVSGVSLLDVINRPGIEVDQIKECLRNADNPLA